MKRSVLLRRTPLRRCARLSAARSRPRTPSDAEREWKRPRFGRCVSCGQLSAFPLHGHHVMDRQTVRRANGEEWDPENRMDLCEACHWGHHYGQANRKIALGKLPAAAVVFACELLGDDLARDYLERRYS